MIHDYTVSWITNHTHGSGWIVHILSTTTHAYQSLKSHQRELVDGSDPFYYEYWLRVAAKHGFAIDQISTIPDHIHMIVRIVPSMSIEECALLLTNNGQHVVWKTYPQVFIEAGINQLWQPSAYAGTWVTTQLV